MCKLGPPTIFKCVCGKTTADSKGRVERCAEKLAHPKEPACEGYKNKQRSPEEMQQVTKRDPKFQTCPHRKDSGSLLPPEDKPKPKPPKDHGPDAGLGKYKTSDRSYEPQDRRFNPYARPAR